MRKKEGKKVKKETNLEESPVCTPKCTHEECEYYDVSCIDNCSAVDRNAVSCPVLEEKSFVPAKKYDEFAQKMDALVEEYGIVNAAFCGTSKEGMFMGRALGKKVYQHNAFDIALNVGRLWQHFRTLTRDVLNTFEKKTW